jgi:hypothetical protein
MMAGADRCLVILSLKFQISGLQVESGASRLFPQSDYARRRTQAHRQGNLLVGQRLHELDQFNFLFKGQPQVAQLLSVHRIRIFGSRAGKISRVHTLLSAIATNVSVMVGLFELPDQSTLAFESVSGETCSLLLAGLSLPKA